MLYHALLNLATIFLALGSKNVNSGKEDKKLDDNKFDFITSAIVSFITAIIALKLTGRL